jgi:hypothetical protein
MVPEARVSDDGKWFWDGSQWSANHAVVIGSIIPRVLAWTLLGGLPLGAFAGLLIGPVASRISSTLGVVVVVIFMIAAEVVVIVVVVRRTPRIAVDGGRIRIGRIGQWKTQPSWLYRTSEASSSFADPKSGS